MKLLIFSDPHCTRNSEFSKPTEDGLNEYLQICLNSFKFVEDTVREYKPDIIAFGGDLWDARDLVDKTSLNVGYRAFNEISKLPVKHKIAVVGNHDYYSIEHNVHTLTFLKGLGWYVFEEVGYLDLDGFRVGGVPFRDSYDADELARVNEAYPNVVISHADVVGGMFREPKSDKDKGAYSKGGIYRNQLDGATYVFNGHYHHPSTLDAFWYNVGALTTRTFHDKESSSRGVTIYDAESAEIQRIENPHLKSFVDIEVNSADDIDALLDADHSGSYARIRYNAEMEEEVQGLQEMFAGVRLLPVVAKPQVETTAVDLRFSLEENLERYLKENYDDEQLNLIALDILKEVAESSTTNLGREPLEFGVVDIVHYQSIKHVRFDLRNKGVIFVRGKNLDNPGQQSNGGGKSAFAEAIYWCLTGKSLRGYKGNEVIHWHEDFTRVSLELFVGGKVYTVVRTRKDPEYKTGVKLFVGHASAGARLSSDTKLRLEDLIGRSEDNLKHVCFLTSISSNSFSRLSYSQRAQLLEDIIDSKPYQDCKKIADKRLQAARLELSSLEGEIKALDRSRETTESRLSELEAAASKYQDDSAVEAVKGVELEKGSVVKELERLSDEKATAEKFILKIEDELSQLRSKSASFDEVLRKVNGEISSLRAEKAVVDSNLERVGTLRIKERCPTCEQPIDHQTVLLQLTGLKAESDRLSAMVAHCVARFNKIELLKMRVDSAVSARDSARQDKQRSIYRLDSSIKNCLDRVDELRCSIEAYNTAKQRVESLIAERQRELKTIASRVREVGKESASVQTDIDRLSLLVSEVFNEKGVRNSIISQVAIPYINSRIPYYTTSLWQNRPLELSGSRELKSGSGRNEIDIVFDKVMLFKGLSYGEKGRVDLILQFALNDLAEATGRSKIDFLVVDEALDALDELGLSAAIEALHQKSVGTVLFVSHRKDYISCSKSITFVKEGGYTKLVEEEACG